MRSRTLGRAAITLLVTCAIGTTALAVRHRQLVGVQDDGGILVPNGRMLTPAGTHIEVNDRPLGMVVSPDNRLLVVVTGSNFNPRALHLIDIQTRSLTQTIAIANSFVGVAFNPAGDTIYVGGGPSNDVKIFKATSGVFAAAGTIPISGGPQPSGLTLSADGSRLYVALNLTHEVGVIDTATRTLITRVKAGTYPYTAVISADSRKVYISNWGGKIPGPSDFTDGQNPVIVDQRTGIPVSGTVSVLDTASNTIVKQITVGLHPTGMTLSPGGDRVYVTNANSDTVSVIDTATDSVAKTLYVGGQGPDHTPLLGASPNAIAVSPDGRTLFVANGARNAVAVVDANATADAVRGSIPTGWYPMAVAVDHSGTELFIGSGYGFGSIAPTTPPGEGRSYTDRVGEVSIVDGPGRGDPARSTEQVRRNNLGVPPDADGNDGDQGQDNNGQGGPAGPIPRNIGQGSPNKPGFYLIKENRT